MRNADIFVIFISNNNLHRECDQNFARKKRKRKLTRRCDQFDEKPIDISCKNELIQSEDDCAKRKKNIKESKKS